MITAIVTSDNHLGAYYARLAPDRLEARREAIRRNFTRVVDQAIGRRVDLFLHAGDLFDRPDPRNAERAFAARQFRRLKEVGIPVFLITGNHDRPRSPGRDGGALPHDELAILDAIQLFRDGSEIGEEDRMIRGHSVRIRGISSNFNLRAGACPLESLPPSPRQAEIEIVLLHYGVEGWAQPFAQEPCLCRENIDRLNADVICVGHLHRPNQARLPGGGLLLNPGATEHITFGEESLDCGFWLLRLEPAPQPPILGESTHDAVLRGRAEGEYVPLPTQPMRTLDIDLHAGMVEESGETLMAELAHRIASVSRDDQLLRVRLQGRISREHFQALDLPALQLHGCELNFHCQLETDSLVVVDEAYDLPIGYGMSFDAGEELQHVAQALLEQFADDPAQQQVCLLAARELADSYERIRESGR